MRNAQKYLEIVRSRGERGLPLKRVYYNLLDPELFLMAYGKLYRNKGAMTKGVDPDDTVEGMSLTKISGMIEALKMGTYQWQPVRRIEIPKKRGKKETRPIGMPTWSDKVVQEVIRIVLEAYYEPQYSQYSHGFRPGRGCHTALNDIYITWKGTKWFIDADIKGFYNNIDHQILLTIIARKIKDKRLLDLLRQMLKAGYIQDWRWHQTYSGVPQGSVLGPLLSNIFLNELDQFVEKDLIPQHTQGVRRKKNKAYFNLTAKMSQAKSRGDIATYKQLVIQRRQTSRSDPDDPHYRRLRYCRYADDVLFGYVGSKQEAIQIKDVVSEFLQHLNLELSEEKTQITNATQERTEFLGYELYTAQSANRPSVNGHIQLAVPYRVVSEHSRRFNQNNKPAHRASLMSYSDFEIVNIYGLELQGLVNYYSLAYNVSKLYWVKYHYQQSLVKTLAAKHKRKATWVYRKYQASPDGIKGLVVTVPNPNNPDKPYQAKFGTHRICRNRNAVLTDTKPKIVWGNRTELVQRLLANECELCGSSQDIRVHHVRALKEIKKKYQGRSSPPQWVQFMMARRRKTVVVCHHCHTRIHSGQYDDIKVE